MLRLWDVVGTTFWMFGLWNFWWIYFLYDCLLEELLEYICMQRAVSGLSGDNPSCGQAAGICASLRSGELRGSRGLKA